MLPFFSYCRSDIFKNPNLHYYWSREQQQRISSRICTAININYDLVRFLIFHRHKARLTIGFSHLSTGLRVALSVTWKFCITILSYFWAEGNQSLPMKSWVMGVKGRVISSSWSSTPYGFELFIIPGYWSLEWLPFKVKIWWHKYVNKAFGDDSWAKDWYMLVNWHPCVRQYEKSMVGSDKMLIAGTISPVFIRKAWIFKHSGLVEHVDNELHIREMRSNRFEEAQLTLSQAGCLNLMMINFNNACLGSIFGLLKHSLIDSSLKWGETGPYSVLEEMMKLALSLIAIYG